MPIGGEAEALAASLPPLLIEASKVAATVQQGPHNRRRSGNGDDFWQYRRYQGNDSATLIDWRQSAKSDPLYVRETEWSSAQAIWLWSDHSASMRWRSATALPEKQDRADLLLLALAIGLVGSGERVGLLGHPTPPAADHAAPMRLAAALGAPRHNDGDAAWPTLRRAVSRHGKVILFSDFLMPLDEIDSRVRQLAASGVDGHVIQILDPAEESLPYDGRIVFSGLEDEGEMLAEHVESLGPAYRQALVAHRAGLQAIVRAVGWSCTVHHTDARPTLPLLALHALLARR